jgi:membrane protease YdiL (CAAX protease family)
MSTPPPPFGYRQPPRARNPFEPHDPMFRYFQKAQPDTGLFWLAVWTLGSLATGYLASITATALILLGGVPEEGVADMLFRSYYALYMALEVGFLWLFAAWLAPQGLAHAVFDLRPVRWVIETGYGLVLFAIGMIFSVTAVDILLPVLPVTPSAPGELYSHGGVIGALLVTATVVIFAPIVEELVMRGWLLPMLVARMGGWILPLVVTSFAFGLLHFAIGMETVIYTSVLGFAAGMARRMTGRLWAPIVMHFANNVFASLPF